MDEPLVRQNKTDLVLCVVCVCCKCGILCGGDFCGELVAGNILKEEKAVSKVKEHTDGNGLFWGNAVERVPELENLFKT